MIPVLQSCVNGEVVTSDVIDTIANEFKLTLEEREQLLPSGKQSTFSNRIHWEKGYLKQAGLLSYPGRSHFVLTDECKKFLECRPDRIGNKFLMRFETFQEFRTRKGTQSSSAR